MLKRFVLLIFITSLFIACQKDNKEKEIARIPVSFEINRFDEDFAKASPKDLPQLKEEYPFLFPEQYEDSVWINLMTDSIQQEINTEVAKTYPNLDKEEKELKSFFQHMHYYYKDFKEPRVITLTSQVDYLNRVILQDELLLISLDTYLGEEHPFYTGIHQYFTKNFIQSQILPDVAKAYAEKYVPKPEKRHLLEYMVYYGKILYFEKMMLPDNTDAQIMGYTTEEMQWAVDNERDIWGYFVERNLLYQTDPDLRRKYLDIGPFTRFGLQLDNESPAQLGQYIGWQMVKQYVEKNKNKSLIDLLQTENELIFKESNYKPKQK